VASLYSAVASLYSAERARRLDPQPARRGARTDVGLSQILGWPCSARALAEFTTARAQILNQSPELTSC
jgi:hypothetical protein